MLQVPRNTTENPLCSTDAGSKMLRAWCEQGIQGQNALNPMQITYLSSKTLQILTNKKFQLQKMLKVQIRKFPTCQVRVVRCLLF